MTGDTHEMLEHMASLSGWSTEDKLKIVCCYIDTIGHKDALMDQVESLVQSGWPNWTNKGATRCQSETP